MTQLGNTVRTSDKGQGPVAWLRPHIHAATVGTDLVLLDAAHDTYLCLPGAGERFDPGAAFTTHGPLAVELVNRGYTVAAKPDLRRRPSITPTRDLVRDELPSPTLRERWDFICAIAWASATFRWRAFDRLPTASRIRRRSLTAQQDISDAVTRRALVFRALLPWSPIQGLCLFQAYVLREFLGQAGLTADWVFGVTTWPFAAHCWIQVDDRVLNDSLERVGRFTPILVA